MAETIKEEKKVQTPLEKVFIFYLCFNLISLI